MGATAAVLLVEGRYREALASAERAVEAQHALGIGAQDVKHGVRQALEAAVELGERGRAEELLAIIESQPPGLRPPFLGATAQRFRARLSTDAAEAGALYGSAATAMRKLELPFHRAVIELEHSEWLTAQGRASEAEPLLAEAAETFEQLAATPWLERAAQATIAGSRTGDAVVAS